MYQNNKKNKFEVENKPTVVINESDNEESNSEEVK